MNINYPKTYEENIKYRDKIVQLMRQDKRVAEDFRKHCSNDILFWFNTFCWTFSQYSKPKHQPFITYKFQDQLINDLVWNIDRGNNIAIEKTRCMGATWVVALVYQWYWQFHEEGDFLVGSETKAKCDSLGNKSSIMEKMRYNIRRQPANFTGKIDPKMHLSHMKLINPINGNTIVGESNEDFGRSGRFKSAFLDEFAFWAPFDKSSWETCSDSAESKIACSTPNTQYDMFFELKNQDHGKIKVIRLHWRQHPKYNTRWYEKQVKSRSPDDVARNVDINYFSSVGGLAAENFDFDIHVRQCRRDPNLPIELNCDFNVNPMFWTLSQTVMGIRYTFAEMEEGTTITQNMIEKFVSHYTPIHRNKTIYIYGDATGRSRSTQSKYTNYDTIMMVLKRSGWNAEMRVPLSNVSNGGRSGRIDALNKRLKDYEHGGRNWEIISDTCQKLIISLQSTEKEKTRKTSRIDHGFDAWSYGLNYEYPVEEDIYGQKGNVFQFRRAVG